MIPITEDIWIGTSIQQYFNDRSMSNDPYDWLDRSLATIERAKWYRQPYQIKSRSGTSIEVNDRLLINFAGNNYLGLADDPRLITAANLATQTYGTGATGSRLVTGHNPLHQELELAISHLKQTESALVYSSGYLANLGIISAIVSDRDLILSDEYNHSSLNQGAKLSGATIIKYRHCDLDDLTRQLATHRHHYRRCAIVTDTVFSMDGDICPLIEICELASQYQAMLVVDEAHATGVFGASGGGVVEHWGLTNREIITVGTLSKALGSLGGFVAGSKRLIEFLQNRSATWIYTTGLSPADTAAALKAIEIINTEPTRRDRLWQNIAFCQQEAIELPPAIKVLPSASAIICWECKDSATALELSQKLQQGGIFAPAIRPPTVPTSRIRITIMATHTRSQLEQLFQIARSL
jgi:8-amino-7-oxononanoate synthase